MVKYYNLARYMYPFNNPRGNESRSDDDPGLTLNPLKTNINGWKIPAMNEDVRILVKMWDFPQCYVSFQGCVKSIVGFPKKRP